MENSYVVRCGVRYAYGISFPLLFFNEWLEKNEIMRSQFQEPKLHRQPEEFCGFFKRSSCFGCSTWGSRKFDKIFR